MFDIESQLSTHRKFAGCATARNGLIIMAPENADAVGVFDVISRTFRLVDISLDEARNNKFRGAIASEDSDLVYFVPHSADGVGVFDAATLSFTLVSIAAVTTMNAKYDGGVLTEHGLVFAPSKEDAIGIFNTTSLEESLPAIRTYAPGVTHPHLRFMILPTCMHAVFFS